MVIPVTTKPFLYSFNFILLPQGVPAFFFINKKESKQHFASWKDRNRRYELISKSWSSCPLLCWIIKLTNFPKPRYGNWSFTNKGGF
jgi:hypothetical protein